MLPDLIFNEKKLSMIRCWLLEKHSCIFFLPAQALGEFILQVLSRLDTPEDRR